MLEPVKRQSAEGFLEGVVEETFFSLKKVILYTAAGGLQSQRFSFTFLSLP